MRSEIILLGNPSSGKSTMVNTLAVNISAETCADQSLEKTREYATDDMDIIDTCGLNSLLQNDDKPGAVGEPPLGPIGAAIANATYRLTGQRLRSMPLKLA